MMTDSYYIIPKLAGVKYIYIEDQEESLTSVLAVDLDDTHILGLECTKL